MTVLNVDRVSKTYGTGHTAVTAVRDVSLTLNTGETVLVMGRSGSGKTTLLTMVGSLLQPSTGSITVAGRDLHVLNARQLATFRLWHVGFVFQSFNLLSALTAEQNVALPLLASGASRRTAGARAALLLDRLEMTDRARHLPRDLSGGEKQRVAIARALVMEPTLLLADEPTANLDSATGQAVIQLLGEIASDEQRGVLIVSHDTRLHTVADRILEMDDGNITEVVR